MNVHHQLRKCPAAVLAVLLSAFLAAAAYAQDKVAGDGALGKVHKAEGVKCVKCHGTAKKSVPVAQEMRLCCHG
jgi:hypothetical protein